MENSLPTSRRQSKRAFGRYGEAIFYGRVGKHSPRAVPYLDYENPDEEGQPTTKHRWSWGSRTPKAGTNHNRNAHLNGLIEKGRTKIRELWLRAGILVVPFEEYEMKDLVAQAKHQFDTEGLVSLDLGMRLSAAGYDVDRITHMWSLMKTEEVED